MDAIAAYLARRPNASDSERGIAQWWISAMGVRVAQDDVRAALERLLQTNLLERSEAKPSPLQLAPPLRWTDSVLRAPQSGSTTQLCDALAMAMSVD